jgi:hypothetical protein
MAMEKRISALHEKLLATSDEVQDQAAIPMIFDAVLNIHIHHTPHARLQKMSNVVHKQKTVAKMRIRMRLRKCKTQK